MTETELYNYVVDKAISFGMNSLNDRNDTNTHIRTTGYNAIIRHNTGENPFFAFIGKDEDVSGKYNGLSFVIFPSSVGDKEDITHCVMAIGIGSATLGLDTALACSPGFRRSFMKLVNAEKDTNYQFFFAENWGEMESRTPGLKEALENTNKTLSSSVNSYDDNPKGHREGLLPAACLIDHFDKDKLPVVDAWLAQYSQWRSWNTSEQKRKSVKDAIERLRVKPKKNEELKKEIMGLMGLDKKTNARKNKYIVLQGAPGCGKTRMALNIADEFNGNVIFTQFHAETTYADFVYGIKPVLSGKELGYEGEIGALLEAIKMAKENKGKVLLIIDEINRANLSNVLGPVFYLFEANAQDHRYQLKLGKIGNDDILIDKLPENLYVIATMNTADRSLAVVDFALRRRFTWYTLYPKVLEDEDMVKGKYFDSVRYNEFSDLFEKYATDDELNLQPGHSYFILENIPDNKEIISLEMKYRLQYELMPLMKEYFNEGYLLNAKEEFCNLFFKYTNEYMYK